MTPSSSKSMFLIVKKIKAGLKSVVHVHAQRHAYVHGFKAHLASPPVQLTTTRSQAPQPRPSKQPNAPEHVGVDPKDGFREVHIDKSLPARRSGVNHHNYKKEGLMMIA